MSASIRRLQRGVHHGYREFDVSLRLTYVDGDTGSKRIMPRYKWAFWAFIGGTFFGIILGVAMAS